MKSLILIVVAHVVGLACLVVAGVVLNDDIKENKYAGLLALLSTAFSAYMFAAGVLYRNNQRVYLWVNRSLLMVRRTHTYWQPAFDFVLPESHVHLDEVVETLQKNLRAKVVVLEGSASKVTLVIDDLLHLVTQIRDEHLHLSLDRKILVPSHLYDAYAERLTVLIEAVSEVVRPESVRLGLTITFGDGIRNPYFGFFVQRVPAQVLRSFEASFLLSEGSSCRIEAGTDCITVDSQKPREFFEALKGVLSLRSLPAGVAP